MSPVRLIQPHSQRACSSTPVLAFIVILVTTFQILTPIADASNFYIYNNGTVESPFVPPNFTSLSKLNQECLLKELYLTGGVRIIGAFSKNKFSYRCVIEDQAAFTTIVRPRLEPRSTAEVTFNGVRTNFRFLSTGISSGGPDGVAPKSPAYESNEFTFVRGTNVIKIGVSNNPMWVEIQCYYQYTITCEGPPGADIVPAPLEVDFPPIPPEAILVESVPPVPPVQPIPPSSPPSSPIITPTEPKPTPRPEPSPTPSNWRPVKASSKRLNLGTILPLAIGLPCGVLFLAFLLYHFRPCCNDVASPPVSQAVEYQDMMDQQEGVPTVVPGGVPIQPPHHSLIHEAQSEGVPSHFSTPTVCAMPIHTIEAQPSIPSTLVTGQDGSAAAASWHHSSSAQLNGQHHYFSGSEGLPNYSNK